MLALNCGHTMKICSCTAVNSRMCESNRQTYEVENIMLLLIIYGISLSGMSMNLLRCLLKLLVIDFRAKEIIFYQKRGRMQLYGYFSLKCVSWISLHSGLNPLTPRSNLSFSLLSTIQFL